MENVIVEFLPLIVGAAVVPVPFIVTLLLLRSESGLLKAVCFVSGMVLVRLAQGIVFSYILGHSAKAQTEEGSDLIVNVILLILGILLWITALKKWQKEEDPDAPSPKWLAMFGSLSARKAFGISIVFMLIAAKQWVFTLGAVSVINEAHLVSPNNAVAYLIFVLGAQSLLLVLILISAVAPNRSAHMLDAAGQWMERNSRALTLVVSVIFGTYFIFKGITGLLG